MYIQGLSLAMAASYQIGNSNTLPNYIKDQLKEIGVDPDSVSGIVQAKKLIADAANKADKTNKEESKNNNEDENPDTRQRAIDLANKIGIKVKDSDTTEDILSIIQSVLDRMLKRAVNTEDEALYNRLKELRIELGRIEADEKGAGYSNTSVMSYMDMLANQNKTVHKLN